MPAHSSEQTVLIEAPGLGVISNNEIDDRHLPDRAWADARNVRFYGNGTKVRKLDSFELRDTTPSSEHVRQLMKHVSLTGVETLVRVTLSKVYKAEGLSRVDITPPGYVAGSVDDIVTWDQYEDLLLFTDKKEVPQKWDGVAATTSDLGGTPPKAAIVRVFKNHVMLLNTDDGVNNTPWRIVYSATGLPETFSGDPTAGDLDLIDTPGSIIAAEVHEDQLVVFKENVVYTVNFVGAPFNFAQRIISAEDGALSARCVVKVGSFLYYLGQNNFYRLGAFPEPIGDTIFRDFLDVADRSKRNKWHAFHRPEHDEIHWMVTDSNAGDMPNFGFIYNYRDNTWSKKDYDPSTSYIRVRLSVEDDTWDGGPAGDWDTGNDISWDDPITAQGELFSLFSQNDGNIQSYRGHGGFSNSSFTAYLESKIFHLNSLTMARLINISLLAKGSGNLLTKLRMWDGERFSAPAYTPLEDYPLSNARKNRVNCRQFGRLAQLRFENKAQADDFILEAYALHFLSGGGER